MLSSMDPDCALRTKGKHGRDFRVINEALKLGGMAMDVPMGMTVGMAWVRSFHMHLTQCHS